MTAHSPPPSTDAAPPVRLALVSSVRLYREGVAHALAAIGGLILVAEYGDYPTAIACQADAQSQVLLVDAASLLADQAVSFYSVVPVVAFGIPEDDEAALACARLGASGLVAAGDPLAELVVATASAQRGELYCSPRLTALLMREVARSPGPDAAQDRGELTPREGEVAVLLESGASNKTIARHLGIEVTTVRLTCITFSPSCGSAAAPKPRPSGAALDPASHRAPCRDQGCRTSAPSKFILSMDCPLRGHHSI